MGGGFDGVMGEKREKDVRKESVTISPSYLPPPHLQPFLSVLACQTSHILVVHVPRTCSHSSRRGVAATFRASLSDVQHNPTLSVHEPRSVCVSVCERVCSCRRLVACPLTGSCYAKCHTSKKDSPPTEKMKSTPSFTLSPSLASFTLSLHPSPPPPCSPLSTEPPHLSVSILFSTPVNYLCLSLTHTLTLVCSPKHLAE